jgi:hypothetical protein
MSNVLNRNFGHKIDTADSVLKRPKENLCDTKTYDFRLINID